MKTILCNASESVPLIAVVIPRFSILFFAIHQTCNAVIAQMLHKFIQCFHCTPIRQSNKG